MLFLCRIDLNENEDTPRKDERQLSRYIQYIIPPTHPSIDPSSLMTSRTPNPNFEYLERKQITKIASRAWGEGFSLLFLADTHSSSSSSSIPYPTLPYPTIQRYEGEGSFTVLYILLHLAARSPQWVFVFAQCG